MWITNLLLCLLFAFSSASYPNLFSKGSVAPISHRFADRNSDGKLTLDEFQKEVLKYNSNFDDKLTQSELSDCIIPWSVFQSTEAVTNFQPAFDALDTNSDGSISFDEARHPPSS